MLSLVISTAIVIILASLGRRIFRLINFRFSSIYEEIAYSGGLGLGLFALVVLSIGLLGILNRPVIVALLALIFLISFRDTYALISGLWQAAASFLRLKPPLLDRGLIGLISLFLFLDIVGTLAPPNAADALVYHLSVAKLYANASRVQDIPFNIYSYLPFSVEMLYSAGMVIYSDVVAKFFHFFSGIFTIFAILGFARRYFNRRVGLLAAVIFLSLPLTTNLMTTAHSDLAATLFFSLSIFSLLIYFERRELRWVLLSALFSGFVAGTKLQPVFLVAALGTLYLIKFTLDREWRTKREFFRWVVFGLIVALVASPWFVKNIVYTGNPLFPHLYVIFGGPNWSTSLSEMLNQRILDKAPGYDLLTFLKAPWRFTVESARLADLGFFFLAFLPFIFLLRERRWLATSILTVAGIYYPLWFFFIYQRHRHWIELAPAFALLVALSFLALRRAGWMTKLSSNFITAVFTGGLLLGLGISITYNAKFFPVAFGFESRSQFLTKHGYIYEPYVFAKQNLPEESRILAYNVWDMTYYLDTDYVLGNPLIQGYVDYSQMQSGEDLLRRLSEIGITHLFFRGDVAETAKNPSNLPSDLQQRADLLYSYIASTYGAEIESFQGTMVSSKTLQSDRQPFILRLFKLNYPTNLENHVTTEKASTLNNN